MSLFDAVDTEEFLRTVFPEDSKYVNDPVLWVKDILGEFFWSKQREVAEALIKHRYVAVKSCHDSGKSHTASRLVCFWEENREDPFATTTAPTTKQVHAILWRYIGQAHRKGKLHGRITLDDEWYAGARDKELIGFGRKPADTDQSAFQGIHALNPLIVVDEACGVPKSIFDAVDSLATNANARVLAIGNPDNPSTHFNEICKPGSGWHVITIDGCQTPNFTEEAVAEFPAVADYMESEGIPYSTEYIPEELRPLLISPEWVDERIKRWGISSPLFASKVRGEFPEISDDALIQARWVTAAQNRELPRSNEPKLGVDVARMGEDETVAFLREGGWARVVWSAHKQSTMVTAGHVVRLIDEINAERPWNEGVVAQIDADGLGAGVYDRLIELGYDVAEYRGGMPAIDSDRFANRRAECYWMLREMFEAGEIDIDPDDDLLASQLQSLKWSLTSRGQIKIESKEDMRKRGMPSPDRADACIAEGETVLTRQGEKPVETVLVGDEVMTRKGWQKVIRSGLTRNDAELVEVQAGDHKLKLTPDHKVFTENRGFIRADALLETDILLVWKKKNLPSLLNSVITYFAGPLVRKDEQLASTTRLTQKTKAARGLKAWGNFMPKSGRQPTPESTFRKHGLFTTLTKIPSTTIRQILCALTVKPTRFFIGITTSALNLKKFSNGSSRLPQNGTDRMQGEHGTPNMAKRHGKNGWKSQNRQSFAFTVVRQSKRISQHAPSSVMSTATTLISGKTGRTTSRLFARCAERLTGNALAYTELTPVHVSAVKHLENRLPVYDLSVENQPEFVVQGILVHNCMQSMAADYLLMPEQPQTNKPTSITGDLLNIKWG